MTDNSLIREIKKYAEEENVPIMQDEGIEFLTEFIIKNNVVSILEVGTAIGYSAIMMALVSDRIRVTTIERDEERYLEAVKNVKKFGLEDRITLIFNVSNSFIMFSKSSNSLLNIFLFIAINNSPL